MPTRAHEAKVTAEAEQGLMEAGQQVIEQLGLDVPARPEHSNYLYLKPIHLNQWATAVLLAVIDATSQQADGGTAVPSADAEEVKPKKSGRGRKAAE